jgi:hypothetical protein
MEKLVIEVLRDEERLIGDIEGVKKNKVKKKLTKKSKK